MVQVDYNHDKQFLEVNSQYVDLIQRKMFYPFIDNLGLQLFFKDKSSQKVILQMSNSNWFIILS